MATKTKSKTHGFDKLAEILVEAGKPTFELIPIALLVPSGFNPRKTFDEASLAELAESIRKVGVLQPIVVRPDEEGYSIVCGERRYRAAVLAGLEAIPAIVRKLTDAEAMEAAIVENLQRQDVDPMEEADGFRALIKSGQYDEQTLSVRLGRTIAYVVGRLRLAHLCQQGREYLSDGMPLGTALLIAPFPEADQVELLRHSSGYSGWISPGKMRQTIKERATKPIARAPWKLDSIDYGRACEGCPKRTGEHPTLLPEFAGEDLCTSPSCWAKKVEALAAEMVEKHPNAIIVGDPTGSKVKGRERIETWSALDAKMAKDYPGQYKVVEAVRIVEGVPKVETVAIRINAPSGSVSPEADAAAAARKKQIAVEREARKLMAGVAFSIDYPYEPVTQGFEAHLAQLGRLLWDQISYDSKAMTWVAGQMGWDVPVVEEKTYGPSGATQKCKKPSLCIENLRDEDALKFLRMLAVQKVLKADDEYALAPADNSDACAPLKALGIDVDWCRAKAADIVDEKEAKKAKGKGK